MLRVQRIVPREVKTQLDLLGKQGGGTAKRYMRARSPARAIACGLRQARCIGIGGCVSELPKCHIFQSGAVRSMIKKRYSVSNVRHAFPDGARVLTYSTTVSSAGSAGG